MSLLFRLVAGLFLVVPTVHADNDPLGVNAGLGYSPGRLIAQPAQTLPALTSQLPEDWRGKPLTLVQLSVLALHNNPQTRVAWETLRVQAAALGLAKSAFWPTLDLGASLTRTGSDVPAHSASGLNQLKGNLSLSWLVWDFGQTQAKVDAAQARLAAAVFSQNAAVQTVLAGVQQAYYQLLGDRELVKSYARTLVSAQAALAAAEAKHRAGQATIADLYQARAAVAAAESTLASGEQAVRSDRGTLAGAVGLPLDTPLRLVALDLGEPPKLRRSVQALMKQALRINPGLQGTRSQVDAALAQLRGAQRSGLPTISFGALQDLSGQQNQAPFGQYSLGLTLSVPLFSGFQRDYQTAQARASLNQAEASLRAGVQSTQLNVWQNYYAFRSASAALPGARAQLENARKALDAVRAQYRVGLATMQDLLSAEATVTSARVALTRDAIGSYKALAGLSAAIGTLTPPRRDVSEGDMHAH